MARVNIDGQIVLTFEEGSRDPYWTAMSIFISEKYGQKSFETHEEVEDILMDCFNFLVGKFKELIYVEKSLTFVQYVFWLHEQSIKLYVKTLSGNAQIEMLKALPNPTQVCETNSIL